MRYIGIAIFIIAPAIAHFFSLKSQPFIFLLIQFFINSYVLFLNYEKKYVAASLVLFYIHLVAIIFFGHLYRLEFSLELFAIPQILFAFSIFGKKSLRLAGVTAVVIELITLNTSYDKNITPLKFPMNYNEVYVIHILTIFIAGIITFILSKPLINSFDQSAKLKETNIELFLSQITFQLRTPIACLQQLTLLLKKEVQKDKNLDQIRRLSAVLHLSMNMACNIVYNIPDIEEIKLGHIQPPKQEPLLVKPFFDQLLEMNTITAHEKNMHLKLYVDMPQMIISDPLNINQISRNLLNNAIKFEFKGTSIDVQVKKTGSSWELKISNVGQPLPKKMIDVIFDPYVTGRSGMIQGTGLGLYIVKNKIISMNGNIQVESKPGGYTVFTVKLPLVEYELGNLNEPA